MNHGGDISMNTICQTTEHTLIVEIYDNASKLEASVGWSKLSGSVDSEQIKAAMQRPGAVPALTQFPPGAASPLYGP